MANVQRVSPFLMFSSGLEDAVRSYVAIIPDSHIVSLNPMSATFSLDGLSMMAFNGGPHFSFSEGFSFFVTCADQAEVDHYWQAFLAGGGAPGRCGWLKDRWGVSWQIIPEALGRYLQDADRDRTGRAMQAMLQMQKIIIADLDRAAAG